jgi:hypothetical protein
MIPNPPSKHLLLHQLQERIQSTVQDAWFFPQRGTVAGFLGTGPVVIVGRRPSWGTFSDEGGNHLFYEILCEFGLENAHLTNFLKSRGNRGDPDPPDRAVQEAFFDEEVRIISPPCLVASMGDAYDQVSTFLLSRGASVIARLPQYASMNYGPAQVDGFRTAVEQLANTARRNGWTR